MTLRDLLERRARIRRTIAALLDTRGFVEVDTPVLGAEVVPEGHIEPIRVRVGDEDRYLQASPELLMKRLLPLGSGPIYQFARAFRAGERGDHHDLEFVLLEWYEPGATIAGTADLLDRIGLEVLGTDGIERLACREAFMAHAGVDPFVATADDLEMTLDRLGIGRPTTTGTDQRWDRGFELLLAEAVQPHLGHGRPTLLERWPASQAALARLDPREPAVAERFELFFSGVELANGWVEETSREVIAERLDAANHCRAMDGRAALPLPSRLLAAHGPQMPAGVGVALGFDRLAMLAAGARSIDAVRPFSSTTA
ncbi:MAG: amino acid--tRNA ligase-related protein [Planctomycetaceae bacterium]